MASSCWWCCKISPITHAFVFFLFVSSSFCHVRSSETGGIDPKNQTFRPGDELQKLRVIRERLNKMNKPAVKTIQSPDGDIIDCVLLHHQPAFDHPKLKGQKPLDPPERPSGVHTNGIGAQEFQLWSMSGESCPEGTVPIRRTTEPDMLRARKLHIFYIGVFYPLKNRFCIIHHKNPLGIVVSLLPFIPADPGSNTAKSKMFLALN
ncbi:hypothetical protein HRI_002192900 [Hibiscus trionum]|uniref:Neprosin activation peptide domain-containing protein n=1 Tax=Hibiscus trionum TaxID=183268 RepID=A0A9W7M2K0_HIBTR|nr:hypothetical protein HRI_002192900 [Hibiscus trionum]